MTPENSWDIMVIGGGPAGSTAAYLLASKGHSVLIIDKKNFPRSKLCAGLLTHKTVCLVQTMLGKPVSEHLFQGTISSHTRNYRIFHRTCEIARGKLAIPFYFIERAAYDHFWLQRAALAGAHVVTGQTVCHVNPQSGRATLADGTRIHARLIIGADGVHSITRRSALNDAQMQKRWNRQLAMTIESRWPCPHPTAAHDYASLHFGYVPWGYAWSFPNRGHRILGIAGLRHKHNQPLMAGFKRFLASICIRQNELADCRGYPLPMGNYLTNPGGPRLLLVGDACGLADPLLGEGIYYAHRSAQIAAQCIVACGRSGESPYPMYRQVLNKEVISELRWIKFYRNFLFMGGRRRKYRGLRQLFSIMPRRLEAAVQGQIPFSRLLWAGGAGYSGNPSRTR